ncbi:hypothetical protein [Proteus mirabilis]|uniref:hypothetical protein n=1 Tax=Proteus mirabilis TaxID=584 RepID=UPI000CE0506B|nr:hypothetical protein [Proteus mirabilis]AVB31242.1 hypothetical protein C3940_14140 [Proteus mirabilis]AZH04416.1 hypothetical protein EHQ78_01330 [Proteus mirabilis]
MQGANWVNRELELPKLNEMCLVAVSGEIERRIVYLSHSELEDENTDTLAWFDSIEDSETPLYSFDYWMYLDSIPIPEGE